MSKVKAAIECFPHADALPSVIDNKTECDGPQDVWTEQPRDAFFDTFNGAVCLDIWETVSANAQTSSL